MPTWNLSFEQKLSWDDLILALDAFTTAFTRQSNHFFTQSVTPLPDPNGANACARRLLTRPDATLEALTEAADGNPRDGWGYHLRLTLTIQQPPLTLHASAYSWDNTWPSLQPSLTSPQPADLDTALDALRDALGEHTDRTLHPDRAHLNVAQALDLDPPRARAWLAEALTHTPGGYGWQELLALDARLNGDSPQKAARRLREAPQDATAWRSPMADDLPATAAVRARLDATAPLLGWLRFEDGLGPLPGRTNPVYEVERALWGASLPYCPHREPLKRDGDDTRSRELRALWEQGPLPRMAIADVITTPGDQTHTLSLWSDHPGQRLTLRWVIQAPARSPLHLGFGACVEGDDDFQARALTALACLGDGRWEPCTFADLFTERAPRDLTLVDPALPPRDHAAALLAITGAPADALDLLRGCRCHERPCQHTRALLELTRAHQRDATQTADPAARHATQARAYALEAALTALQKPKKYRKSSHIRGVEAHVAQRNALLTPTAGTP